jgi:hypothetical protein
MRPVKLGLSRLASERHQEGIKGRLKFKGSEARGATGGERLLYIA